MKTGSKPPTNFLRQDGRSYDHIRRIRIRKHYVQFADGSVLIEMGRTKVLCAATIEESIPRWMREQPALKQRGWVSAEYSMAPYASSQRKAREPRGRADGRSTEIQRLIGRSLRAVVNSEKLGPRTIWLDCDVLQADGGTRTAAITGAFVALVLALRKLKRKKLITEIPIKHYLAAVSVGLFKEQPILDLNYDEDSQAEADLNIVMTDDGRYVEVNGGGEAEPISQKQLEELLALARRGIEQLIAAQKKALAPGNSC